MKKTIIICIFLFELISNNTWANAIFNLKSRLDKINNFYASFIQKVIDSDGNIMQEGQGDLWIKRPNLFNYHLLNPDENILISDGDTLWIYNPLIEQVTATWLKDKIDSTPFILIMNNKMNDLKQYHITQKDDNFILVPKEHKINLEKLVININKDGIIYELNFVETDGQNNIYQFKSQKSDEIDESKFKFIPPHGITIDDQRNR